MASSQGEEPGSLGLGPELNGGFVRNYAGHSVAKQLTVAFLTLVVWDFIITLDDSLTVFWAATWSTAKVMYIINWCNGLFTVTAILLKIILPLRPATFCNAITWLEFVGTVIVVTMISLAMITRVYALWNRDRRVLVATLLGFFMQITVYIVMTSTAYATGSIFPVDPPFTGCFILLGNHLLWIMFIPNIAFETLIVGLTVYKSWSIAVQSGIRAPVFTMLLSDALLYYWVIIGAQILSFVCMMVPSPMTLPIIGSYPTITVTVVACSRLLIRLQRLLLSESKGQSGFTTEGFGRSMVPEVLYEDNAKGPNTTNPGDIRLRSMNNKRGHAGLDFEVSNGTMPDLTVPLDHHKDSQPSTSRQAR
ncbi:hypothetical protein M408DRAFT_21145 [Serendipita vermifera MAFF 305830]|uniref:DUF6533 domain-containing protein n=1 Tax=Serendipita vermifera MAFF 305830 TaxID=933852 RepID=A0A0C2X109_SERVB|nr:hypothetical protein M408DRAFT_21145 [Serendipita vermifera MAFF 305830]